MPATSAGILAFRRVGDCLDVLLVHPGGPYWRNKDDGAWSIPKGEVGVGEEPEEAARREFEEELGLKLTEPLRLLGRIRQKAGKWVDAYAVQKDVSIDDVRSNTFELEWPPRSGRMQSFLEIDEARWFDIGTACQKINPGQNSFF